MVKEEFNGRGIKLRGHCRCSVSTALVMLMTVPGVALFYGGLKKKDVLNTMFMSLVAFSVTSLIWVLYGYTVCLPGPDIMGFIGSPVNLFMNGTGVENLRGGTCTNSPKLHLHNVS